VINEVSLWPTLPIPGLVLPNLTWTKNHQPEVWRQVRWALPGAVDQLGPAEPVVQVAGLVRVASVGPVDAGGQDGAGVVEQDCDVALPD